MRRQRWQRRRRLLLLIVAATAGLLGVGSHAIGVFHRLELSTIDTRFSIRGSRPALVKDIVLVRIDASTLQAFHRIAGDNVPPRRFDARVIERLHHAGAKVIAVDLQFTQATDGRDDNALANALYDARHVLLGTSQVGPHGTNNVLGGNAVLASLHGARAGDVQFPPDTDGVLRRMVFQIDGLKAFSILAAGAFLGHPVAASEMGGPNASVPIDFAGPPFTVKPQLSLSDVYFGHFDPAAIKGKIVIVGATASILQDVHATATSAAVGGGLMSGPELEANAVATALAGFPLRGDAGWVNVLLILLMGSLGPLFGSRGWAVRTLIASALVGLGYAALCQRLFNSGHIVAFVDPEAALALGTVGTLGVVYLSEAFERQYARTVFSRFVPPGVVDEVLSRTDDDLRLGGIERVCTVMFSDLRGFTTFSESQPAEHVIAVVNFYLNEMTEAILAAGGTLIDYMGDGIMAVFGAPLEQADHADRALRAAREMLAVRLPRFNRWLAEQGHDSGFRMGIGLNSGKVMAGNVGAAQRVAYTAIGDATNTAARLESMTKDTPHMLFVSANTCELLANKPADLIFVDELEVRGRTAKLGVYSIPDTAAG